MKTRYLLPNKFESVGWVIFIPSFILGLTGLFTSIEPDFLNVKVFALVVSFFDVDYFTTIQTNLFDEIIGILLILGLIFIAFSKEKREDEYISKIRLESLVWATYVNYSILILAILFVYEFAFFTVMIFNMFTILLFFTFKFKLALYRSKKISNNEE